MGEDKATKKQRKGQEAAAMAVEQAEQKKSKKHKREEEEPEAANGAVDEAEAKRARKKAKKEAKRLAKLQQEQGQANGNGHAAAAEEDGNGEAGLSKEERKRLKKERKRLKKERKAAAGAENGHANGGSSSSSSSTSNGHAPTSSLSAGEVQKWWEEHEIVVSGRGCEKIYPVLNFQDAGFPSDLLECTKGFQKPTPIQSQCWPVLMGGRDIIGIAETGSGKTLTFSLPGLCRVREAAAQPGAKKNVTRMLVVAPTRELAMQSQEVLDKVLAAKGLKGAFRSVCLFGGVPKHEQRKALRNGVDVIVATPGRLVDLMEEGECDLSQVTYLVLDEADRMLDQGFEQAIRQIIGATAPHPRRQTALLSATWPQAIQALAGEFLQDPVKVVIGGEDLSSNKRVQQIVEVVPEFDREKLLRGLLQKYHAKRDNRVLIFALYKKEAARLEQNLQRAGYACLGIHGDKSQTDRIQAVNRFKTKEIPLLIATDVAARGLDIPDVEVVINYSFPLTIEDYVHRIGRTGRAGKTGVAHTFFHQGDKGNAGALVNTLRQAEQPVPQELLKFGTAVKKKEHKLYGAFGPKGGDMDMNKKPTKIVFGDDD